MWIDGKFKKIKKILEKENCTLLDVGCRDQILKKFINNNISYTGIDIQQNKEGTNIIKNLNRELNINDNSYDVVTALDVIEHIEEPVKVIENLIKISKKKLIINLPNIAYYEARYKFLIYGNLSEKYHFSGFKKDDRHYWFTNYFMILEFFKKNFDNYSYQIIPVFKTRNKLKILFFLEKMLSKILPNLFTWSIIIILKKKNK